MFATPLERWRQLQRVKEEEGFFERMPTEIRIRLQPLSELTEEQAIQLTKRCPRAVDLTPEIIQGAK